MHVQSYCFADQTYCFFDVLVAIAVVVTKAPFLCFGPCFVLLICTEFSCFYAGPPFIMPQTKTIYVMARKAAFLSCNISGVPAPTVYWTVTHPTLPVNVTVVSPKILFGKLADGTSFQQQLTVYDNGTLHISEVNAADNSGRFQCIAMNDFGSAYGNVSLVVLAGRSVRQFLSV